MELRNIQSVVFLILLSNGIALLIPEERLVRISKSIDSAKCESLIWFLEEQHTATKKSNSPISFITDDPNGLFSCFLSLSKWNQVVASNFKNATELLRMGLNFVNYTESSNEGISHKSMMTQTNTGNATSSIDAAAAEGSNKLDIAEDLDFGDPEVVEDDDGEDNYELRLPPHDTAELDIRIMLLCVVVVFIILFQTYMVAKEAARNMELAGHRGETVGGCGHSSCILDVGNVDGRKKRRNEKSLFGMYNEISSDDGSGAEEIELMTKDEDQCAWGQQEETTKPLL